MKINSMRASYLGVGFLFALVLSALATIIGLFLFLQSDSSLQSIYWLLFSLQSVSPILIHFYVRWLSNKSSLDSVKLLTPKLEQLVTDIKTVSRPILDLNGEVKVLMNPRSDHLNADVRWHLKDAAIVLTAGSASLAFQDSRVFSALLVHEMAHVAHKDISLWRYYDVYGYFYFVFILPFITLMSGLSIALRKMILPTSNAESEIVILGVSTCFAVLFGLLFFKVWLAFCQRCSEETADMAVIEAGYGPDLIRLLETMQAQARNGRRGLRIINWRLKKMRGYLQEHVAV